MAFRLVRTKGAVAINPTVIGVFASGVIRPGCVVDFDRSNNRVFPASSNSTYTTIIGIALDYVAGASDSKTRIVPFSPGQLWEGDITAAGSTAQLFLRHALTDMASINNTTSDVNGPTGVFIAYAVSLTSSTRLVGEFIRTPISQR